LARSLRINSLAQKPKLSRLAWIDWLRGLAVVAMIVFHFSYDLTVEAKLKLSFIRALPDLYWIIMPKIIGGLFFILMGVSAYVRHQSLKHQSAWITFRQPLLRILLGALIVSFATSFLGADRQIKFGVLHGLAASLVLLIPVIDRPKVLWVVGLAATIIGIVFRFIVVPFEHFWWLGFFAKDRSSFGLDVYPILPWVGIVYLSVALSPRLIQIMQSTQATTQSPFLRYFGRHSLIIYLIHQPILIGCIKVAVHLKNL
jgi:uncharacterized membrane protein